MRFLIKVPIPTLAENALVGDPKFNEKLQGLFTELGAQAIFTRLSEDRRLVAYALFDVQTLSRLLEIARPVSLWLKVKLELLPETVAKSYFGDVTLPARYR